ncbi:hypothetical protein [Hyphomicrobium sp.]|uniref:hypothetical protein n=1 Tax=Hyphomicrobium sp. TaxID=82 RepID=UPI0025C70C63|nr:hypothetical protein [Hyphomicrobium sp.]MCC7251088.1 hypothetical protein [Hyphomicrobium sp.]
MASGRGKLFFTSEELLLLQRAFDLACADLKLGRERGAQREQLGAFIFQVASTGKVSVAGLRRQSVQRFRHWAAPPPVDTGLAGVLRFADGIKGQPRTPRGRR